MRRHFTAVCEEAGDHKEKAPGCCGSVWSPKNFRVFPCSVNKLNANIEQFEPFNPIDKTQSQVDSRIRYFPLTEMIRLFFMGATHILNCAVNFPFKYGTIYGRDKQNNQQLKIFCQIAVVTIEKKPQTNVFKFYVKFRFYQKIVFFIYIFL